MSIILAIDSGTTSTRVIAFDKNKTIVHIEQKPLAIFSPSSSWVEQDANEIWHHTYECLKKTLDYVGPQNVISIGITNQRETSIIWDRTTGKVLGPAINWQCRRTHDRCTQLKHHKLAIKKKTGLPLDAYFSASKFEWLLANCDDTKTLIEHRNLCLGTVDTWLLFNLTNGTTYATDVTNASRTMLFNIHTCKFDRDLCELFNIPIDVLPTVKNSFDDYGTFEFNQANIPIRGVIGDQQAALFAQCGRQSGNIKNTYGTGLFIMANTGSQCVNTENLVTTIAVGLDQTIDYAIEGSIFTGGSLIQWLRDNLGLIKTSFETEGMAQSVTDNAGVSVLPALSGLGAPHWKPKATGMILGLTQKTTRAHIIRAALESIALQTNDVIQVIKKECPQILFKDLLVDGGASQNNWLMQLQADVCDLTIIRPQNTEATALGAALCAAHNSSFFTNDPINIERFYPKIDQNELKSQWKATLSLIN